ncbi:MAG: hypothetical protein ACFHWX_18630 [Bacteroidota bacterium]
MNLFLTLLYFLTFPEPGQLGNDYQSECDSTSIATTATKFYSWYLNNLEDTRPKESWMNKELEIQSDLYFQSLNNLNIASESFFEQEKRRFQSCIDSATNISYQRILDCGCSVGMLVNECQFLDDFYWIRTHEIYDGFVINNIDCNGTTAVCELQFYYGIPTDPGFDEYFTSKIQLSKYGSNWLIDKIEPERRKRN